MLRLTRPAPALGQHTREVYVDELGVSAEQLDSWREQGLV